MERSFKPNLAYVATTRRPAASSYTKDSFRFLKFFMAFNAEQIEGLSERFSRPRRKPTYCPSSDNSRPMAA